MTKGLFSVVVALYGVENYVDTFLTSLERQTFPFEDLDIIVVDDASIDGSYDKVKKWSEKYPGIIRHTTKSNGGPASARNIGIGMAKNQWITFSDPDDALQEKYFENVENFIKRDTGEMASILTTRVMIWQEKTGKISDNHPLARKYFFGDRLVDLDQDPHNIQLGGATIFMRRSIIDKHQLRFDERIRPTFEDGEFIGRFMSYLERPVVGLVSSARYLYRKRGDGSSLVQSGWGHPERYDEVLRYGYLGLFKGLQERLGHVPVWAQNMVLYDIQWYLSEDKKMNSSTAWLSNDQRALLLKLLQETFSYIERDTIDRYNVTPWSWITREAILAYYKGQGLKVQRAYLWSKEGTSPTRIVYTYRGVAPTELFMVNGTITAPSQTKSVIHAYYGENFMVERSVWLTTSDRPTVLLNNEFVRFESPKRPGWGRPVLSGDLALTPAEAAKLATAQTAPSSTLNKRVATVSNKLRHADVIRAKLANRVAIDRLVHGGNAAQATLNVGKRVVVRKVAQVQSKVQKHADKATLAWANSAAMRAKYENAWVVMDRVDKADDNGEHLYRYLMKNRPDINAWFLLQRSSQDWTRLANEGFRLVEYGSREAVALSLAAQFQISSDATHGVQYPLDEKRFGSSPAKIIFLQHGVIKDDLSRWLNGKNLAMFVTSTKPEYESIAGDYSPYKFTSKETKLTGLPRFDALLEKRGTRDRIDRNVVVIMPTWRQALRDDMNEAGSLEQKKSIFQESQFGENWMGLLNDPRLKVIAESNNLDLVFIPHPAMSDLINVIDFPEHIRVFDSSQRSLQDELAKSAMTITDYSSIAFDAAFVGSPVLYFQFDSEAIFSGSHSYRKGYFNYETAGFGPTLKSIDEVVKNIDSLSDSGFIGAEIYQERAKNAFAFIDSNNCERVVQSIQDL
ncbi:CDP-glycerol glycerophosphotransferase family protein [Specibacter sp. NPDC057265]|uniref:bifunctional glycosyltransferase/CDP-glycerol:glycerophosphate glycerophosphotransferase n=1 Tax=Specibacter sp. NPDC057265 TaxID=3346075 RepID=UPI00363287D4